MIQWLKHIKRFLLRTFANLRARIWQRRALIAWRQRRPGRPHGLAGPLVVSLTSYPKRFGTLHLTIKCLLMQSIMPDRVILWIAHGDREKLTPDIMNLLNHGLEIRYCDDTGSFKKIIPTLTEMPDSFVVTADDDLYYWPTWLEELVTGWSGDPTDVVCHRAHLMTIGDEGLPKPYANWRYEGGATSSSFLNFPTSGFGVLYPPGTFHHDVLDVEKFTRLCPKADDIWLYWMMRLNGAAARKIGNGKRFIEWPGSQNDASLFHYNFYGGGNDAQISAMIRAYGFPDV